MSAGYTVFGNIRVNDRARLNLLKTWLNYASCLEPSDVVVKIRGAYSTDACALFCEKFQSTLLVFDDGSDEDWAASTLQMLECVQTDTIVYIVEDHFFLSNAAVMRQVAHEFAVNQIDILHYSWFGETKLTDIVENIEVRSSDLLAYYDLDFESNKRRIYNSKRVTGHLPGPHISSLAAIYAKPFLAKILSCLPNSISRFSQGEPFDLERTAADIDYLPVRVGESRLELFACLDDDNVFPASSLHGRGVFKSYVPQTSVITRHNWCYVDAKLSFEGLQTIKNDPILDCYLRVYEASRVLDLSGMNMRAIPYIFSLLKLIAGSHVREIPIVCNKIQSIVLTSCLPLFYPDSWFCIHTRTAVDAVRIFENTILNDTYSRVWFSQDGLPFYWKETFGGVNECLVIVDHISDNDSLRIRETLTDLSASFQRIFLVEFARCSHYSTVETSGLNLETFVPFVILDQTLSSGIYPDDYNFPVQARITAFSRS